ncbi:hypothetical protein EJB05_13510 [Eragrostis curvula]|uniref:galactinol--sucrose galactosyltransferase n=1 Tax=Eragrostis curvula TaxID=38414 RepID=A0A5J9VUG8_9POAL|nr:hypothetical protein EJB05_13510 [Eragrostis curvula]
MTVTPLITVSDGKLAVRGRTVLTGVPDNVTAAHASGAGLVEGAFIGADAGEAKSIHVFTLGTLRDCRFLCLFRFKLWWMTQRTGVSGRDVPLETQFMLIEVPPTVAGEDNNNDDKDDNRKPLYVVVLPLLEGQFRSALQGTDADALQVCVESGDKAVQTSRAERAVYVHAGDSSSPFDAVAGAVKAVEKQMGQEAFRHRERKRLPSFVDWFGWCTWDAFYTDVTAGDVTRGLRSLGDGGAPPRFLIIDDGWQQIASDAKPDDKEVAVQEGAQFASRLTGIKENAKFQKHHAVAGDDNEQENDGLKRLVSETKQVHGVKQVYVWHAMAGYWGGVSPTAPATSHYSPSPSYPTQSPGVTGNQPDIVADSLSALGLGLVPPRKAHAFYSDLHAYLASCGVDGVKVDVQAILETVGAGHGGRVAITKAYHRALEASVAKSFPDNGCVSCMCHNTDMLYSARQTAVVRASDDFYPRDPASHTVHVAAVAYNSVFLGEFMQPDWDMFHSLHPAAEYHGAARAIGGCPIYVSDKPGNHDFELLRKLVLPDGSVLRAQLPGRPTRDCLFSDPARDGASLLKIWNLNKCGGVVGAFNCQGAGWCRVAKKTRVHDAKPGTLTAAVRADDVDAIRRVVVDDESWDGEAVVYAHRSGDLVRLPKGAALPVTLGPLQYELFHVCPVRTLAVAGHGGASVSFAPVGLLDMFNAGGAVEECAVKNKDDDGAGASVSLRVRGCGRFGAYCSVKPARCLLDAAAADFGYDADTGLVAVDLPVPEKELYRWTLQIMTVTPLITVSDGRLAVRGRTVLTGVPDNVTVANASGAGLVEGAFIGADAGEDKSIHVFTLGTLRDCRFLCLFRFKLWWMTQRMGVSGRDVPLETQFMLIEVPPTGAGEDDADDTNTKPVYVVVLPLLEGQFRSALQGTDADALQVCVESGDKAVQTSRAERAVYVHASGGGDSDSPFDAVAGAVKAVEKQMGGQEAFRHRERKRLPSFVDWFGWCTWDAFYTDVTAGDVTRGVRSLADGGAPPRFLIIDDGWQQIASDGKPDQNVAVQEGAQFASRLTGIKENAKFQHHHADDDDKDNEQQNDGLKRLVSETKQTAVVRASDDFYPRDPASHTVHVASVAYNSVFLGEFMQPDWDMFHSLHPAAEYHGAARAIGGCPIYVSDKPGNHDFELLRKLVLPDNRQTPIGYPVTDRLSTGTYRLLKIWNLNKCGGVVGAINCQGAGWCRVAKSTRVHDAKPGTLTAAVRADDVDAIRRVVPVDGESQWDGEAVVYAHRSGELVRLPRGAALPVTLGPLEYELFHVCPVRAVGNGAAAFAPVGLLDMFNAGGAVEECAVNNKDDDGAAGASVRSGCAGAAGSAPTAR